MCRVQNVLICNIFMIYTVFYLDSMVLVHIFATLNCKNKYRSWVVIFNNMLNLN